jgi:nicotinamide-nucleotide amidase
MVAARLTEQAGSSDFFVAGFVTYNDEQKASVLGISRDLLHKHSAVSEVIARAMAQEARRRTGATYALSTTGYAGPSGGTEFDPIGTVYLGIAGPVDTRVIRIRHGADRYRIRMLSTQAALDLARRTISGR